MFLGKVKKGGAGRLFGPMSYTGERIASAEKTGEGRVKWVFCTYAVMEQVEEVLRSELFLQIACWV